MDAMPKLPIHDEANESTSTLEAILYGCVTLPFAIAINSIPLVLVFNTHDTIYLNLYWCVLVLSALLMYLGRN